MLSYSQSKGTMISGDGSIVFVDGYAGRGDGKNNPAMQNVKGIGPLPQGVYRMTDVVEGSHLGAYAIRLVPLPANIMFGRGDFFIHGDSASHPGEASDGCIIKSPALLRRKCFAEKDKLLRVIK